MSVRRPKSQACDWSFSKSVLSTGTGVKCNWMQRSAQTHCDLEASRQPNDPIEAAVRSMMKALGISEEKARTMLASAADAEKKVAKK